MNKINSKLIIVLIISMVILFLALLIFPTKPLKIIGKNHVIPNNDEDKKTELVINKISLEIDRSNTVLDKAIHKEALYNITNLISLSIFNKGIFL
ncbi:MAG: hypothetical protein LN567_07270 [Rickettsia endosymbiont of Graphium doson]|nr:hypothetical protein [Rickettsia endosymbiont of Graphium doson]